MLTMAPGDAVVRGCFAVVCSRTNSIYIVNCYFSVRKKNLIETVKNVTVSNVSLQTRQVRFGKIAAAVGGGGGLIGDEVIVDDEFNAFVVAIVVVGVAVAVVVETVVDVDVTDVAICAVSNLIEKKRGKIEKRKKSKQRYHTC